jgi:hypothetical protein
LGLAGKILGDRGELTMSNWRLTLLALAVTVIAVPSADAQSTEPQTFEEYCEILVQSSKKYASVSQCVDAASGDVQGWCRFVVEANENGLFPDGIIYKNVGDCMKLNKAP